MKPQGQLPVVLSIAGSDSGGGAGIQADLKTWASLGVFGTTALTCLTAQNPDKVSAIHPIPPRMVAAQIDAVRRGFPIAAVKTGMLFSAPIIQTVALFFKSSKIPHRVVDPVMIATSGACLLKPSAVRALCDQLLPRATVVTPNVPEAEVLTGCTLRSEADLHKAACIIQSRWGCAAVVKGGHLKGDRVMDIIGIDGETHTLVSRRVAVAETHGTGCTFSAALTAFLALGLPLFQAAREAKRFVHAALAQSRPAGSHHPLNFAARR